MKKTPKLIQEGKKKIKIKFEPIQNSNSFKPNIYFLILPTHFCNHEKNCAIVSIKQLQLCK